jgi:hypothetical protein
VQRVDANETEWLIAAEALSSTAAWLP